jgi:hypothetical protein
MSSPNTTASKLPDTNQSRFGRALLKRVLYSQMSLLDAVKILLGKTQPRVNFTVKAEPASVYWNFRIKAEMRDAFIEYINLPEGFRVCPIRCLQGEEDDFLLTLNVYEVSGIAVGIRAEWSTYILDQLGKPRYMVLEAQSSEISVDPIDIITRKSRVEHSSVHGTQTLVENLQGEAFVSTFDLPENRDMAIIHPEWVGANDFIYWRVGICDRTFYDAGLANPQAILLDPASATIDNQTHWARFVEPVPKHLIQFEQSIDFVIMPWVNI